MIKNNRTWLIKTTIVIVFLFAILSLPIFNTSSAIFVQNAKAANIFYVGNSYKKGYEKCNYDNFNNFNVEDLVRICKMLEGTVKPFVHEEGTFALAYYFPCLTEQEFKGSMWDGSKKGWEWYGTYKSYDEYLTELKKNLSAALGEECNKQDKIRVVSIVCNFCKNPNERTTFDTLAQKISSSSLAVDIQNAYQPADCLEDYSDLSTISVLSPGRLIRGFFAGIAIGLRGILGYVADAFVWSFTGLPQKVGGYVHFMPIYDSSTKTGIWYTLLNFSYLGIVLGMIFSSIATFFGIEKYSWKQMFPKLILIALLINFSIVILGIFVDISNYLSMIFLAHTENQPLGDTIKNVVTSVSCAIAGTNNTKFVPTMTGTTIALILSGIFLFQFVGLLFYVITRIFTIWICVATSPLAFLGMAIDVDPIKKLVNIWRDRFTQAIISLPILSFALYFVLIILTGIGNQLNDIAKSGNALHFPMLITYAALIVGAAQILRFVANSIGIEQIEKGYNFAKGLAKTATFAAITAAGGFALTKLLNSERWSRTQKALLEKGAQGGGIGLVAGNLGRWMSKTQNSFTAQRYKGVSDTLANESPDVIRTRLAQYEALGDKERATIALGILAQKGKLTWEDLPRLAKYINYSNFEKNIKSKLDKYNDIKLALDKPYFEQAPDLAYKSAIRDLVPNIIAPGKINDLANWNMVFNTYKKDKTILDAFAINLASSLKNKNLNPKQITNILNKIAYVLVSTNLSNPDKHQIASEIIKTLKNAITDPHTISAIDNSPLNKI
jgi:hypothetical protein